MEPHRCNSECDARTCAGLEKNSKTRKCSKKCRADKCRCKSGLYLNESYKCVPKSECNKSSWETPIKCPGRHEELVPCFYPEFANNCRNWVNGTSCTPNAPREVHLYDTSDATASWPEGQCIRNVCDCRQGYYRNRYGICVRWDQCDIPYEVESSDPCSDPNEKRYKEWRECDERTCVNLKYPMKQDSSNVVVQRNKCDCKSSYYRDHCGRCVPKADCDDPQPCRCTNPCKKENQVLRCINSCTKQTCAKILDPSRICKRRCRESCDCNDHFWLNKHGECVPDILCTREDVEATRKTIDEDDVIGEEPIVELLPNRSLREFVAEE